MAKGILMSKEGHDGILLTSEGAFVKIVLPSLDAAIGDEVEGELKRRSFNRPKPILSALAAACLFLFVLIGTLQIGGSHQAVAAYVSFDINPSFEAGIDKALQVKEVHPMNSDGSKVLKEIPNYKNMSLKTFTQKVADVLDKEGYFKQEPSLVISTAVDTKVTGDKAKKMTATINQAVQEIKKQPDFSSHQGTVQVLKANMKTRKTAAKEGMTAGKFILYKKVNKVDPTVTVKKAKTMSVKDLYTYTHESTKKTTPKQVPSPQGQDNRVISPANKGQLKKQTNDLTKAPSLSSPRALKKGNGKAGASEAKGKGGENNAQNKNKTKNKVSPQPPSPKANKPSKKNEKNKAVHPPIKKDEVFKNSFKKNDRNSKNRTPKQPVHRTNLHHHFNKEMHGPQFMKTYR
ncbi:anti-sigma factor domain-containing protein [Pullulanibacillus sp. KACC 23026]|uniref:anti-sigma factor domain-containing protein n=1 Tax=Pullulanibacillus sp. KACC 23026 TaxID=3028315 RepID=UPI0023B1917D|nr:anti-sigma factor domain-containing protein [Pullulanibacillus sp. KACC 23026]WEG13760.1 anti-sigma factor domain-containing protein [Pullulanibacillus sp. KACC 23026]